MYERKNPAIRVAELLREERAASDVYEHALDLMLLPHQYDELRRIRLDHCDAADCLKRFVLNDEIPDVSPGGWLVLSRAVNGVEKLYGRQATIKTIQDGEQLAIHDMLECLRDYDMPEQCKTIIKSTMLPQAMEHVKRLEQIMQERSEVVELL